MGAIPERLRKAFSFARNSFLNKPAFRECHLNPPVQNCPFLTSRIQLSIEGRGMILLKGINYCTHEKAKELKICYRKEGRKGLFIV